MCSNHKETSAQLRGKAWEKDLKRQLANLSISFHLHHNCPGPSTINSHPVWSNRIIISLNSSHFVPHNLYSSAKRVILTTFNIRSLLPCLKSSEDPILSQGIRSNVLILAHLVLPECPLLASFTSPLSPEHLVPALFAHSSVGTLYLFFLPREFTPCALIAYGFLLPI